MSKSINFNTRPKQFLNVTLPDEKKTVLMVCMPTKGLFGELIAVNERSKEGGKEEIIDDLYDVVAKVLSRNKGGIKVTSKQLDEWLDFDDVMYFFKEYVAFVRGISNSKN